MRSALVLSIFAVGVLALAALAYRPGAHAAGPCGTPHDALDAEETLFLSLVQAWRDQNLQTSTPLQASGALNAAAAWFAQWQVDNGAPGGHVDSLGRTWVQRALDCGYTGTLSNGTPYAMGSGEGIRAYAASQPITIPAAQAAAEMAYPGSGLYAQTASSSLPFKCVGAARAASADGRRVAWVVIIAQYPASAPCPGSSTVTSPTATATATPTSPPPRTPSPTPTPTPRADGAQVAIWAGWNLVQPPAGPVVDVLARAQGCYRSVYAWDGQRWLRFIPGGPAYVNTLAAFDGRPVWIEGTAANCGVVLL